MKCTQLTWRSDLARWLHAPIMMDTYLCNLKCPIHEVTINSIKSPSVCTRQLLLDLSVLLTDMGLVLAGHEAALAEPVEPSKRGSQELSKYQAGTALHDLMWMHELVKKDEDESPSGASEQFNAVVASTWLAKVQEQLASQPSETIVPSGFARAVRAGAQCIQCWLSRSTTLGAPSLLVETQAIHD